jgi:hypothetical protein
MYDRPESPYLQGANTAVVSDLGDLPLTSRMMRCSLPTHGQDERGADQEIPRRLSHRAWRLKPGRIHHVRFDERGIDAVLEGCLRCAGALPVRCG